MRRILSLVSALFVLCGIFAAPARADDVATCKQFIGDDALVACTRLISSKKLRGADLVNAYTWRGITHVRFKGEWDKAIADFSEAIRLDPKNTTAYAGRAASHLRKGNLDRGLADLNEGRRIDPKHVGIHNVFGIYYTLKGDYDRALVELNEALRLSPQYQFAYIHRGETYEHKGELNKALADFRTALSFDPTQKGTAGRQAAEGIRRVEQKLAALGSAEWTACFNGPHSDERIAACTHLIAGGKLRGDDLTQAYFRRGVSYAAFKGDFDRAIADLNEAVRLDPKHAFAISVRGAAFVYKRDFDRALADLNEALRLDPKLASVHNNFGLYHNAKGDYDRALLALNEALRINSQNPFAYSAAARPSKTRVSWPPRSRITVLH